MSETEVRRRKKKSKKKKKEGEEEGENQNEEQQEQQKEEQEEEREPEAAEQQKSAESGDEKSSDDLKGKTLIALSNKTTKFTCTLENLVKEFMCVFCKLLNFVKIEKAKTIGRLFTKWLSPQFAAAQREVKTIQ